jgi:hypothetical protein
VVHPATGLQVELKQDSNGWFALRGGGGISHAEAWGQMYGGGPLDEHSAGWREPPDACVWSDGGVQTHAEGAGMRIPAAVFSQLAARRGRGWQLCDASVIGSYKYGFWRLAVSQGSLLLTNWHERDEASEHILLLTELGGASFTDRSGTQHALRGSPLLAYPLRWLAFAAGMHRRLGEQHHCIMRLHCTVVAPAQYTECGQGQRSECSAVQCRAGQGRAGQSRAVM